MRSSIICAIQECYCDCVSFGITPNFFQEISSVVPKLRTLVCLFYPLIVSIKETKMFILTAKTLPSKWAGWGGGVLPEKLGGGVQPASQNP